MAVRLAAAVALALAFTACGGSANEQVEVPRVVGLPTAAAQARIGAYGLCVASISWGGYSPAMAARVLTQHPPAGRRVESGTSVALTVAPASPAGDVVEGSAAAGCAAPDIQFPAPG